MNNMKLVCSECNGEIKIENNQYICKKCGRIKQYEDNEEVNMNDNTKDYDQVLFG